MHRDIEFLRDVGLAVIPMGVVYIAERIQNIFFPLWQNGDIHLHLLGGAAAALGAFILWIRWTKRKWLPAIPPWLTAWTILGTAVMIGVVWEFREWIVDAYFHPPMPYQQSLTETMNDFGMDIIGALIVIALFVPWRSKGKSSKR